MHVTLNVKTSLLPVIGRNINAENQTTNKGDFDKDIIMQDYMRVRFTNVKVRCNKLVQKKLKFR